MAEKINVWTYWHSEERPEIVNHCIESWRQQLDSDRFRINIVSENNLSDYLSPEWINQIPNFQDLEIANQADFIRLSLLKFHGGIWLDATIYLLRDLSFIPDFNKFYAPRILFLDTRTVQVFFLVAPKNDYIVSEWLKLYTNILKQDDHLEFKWYRINFYALSKTFRIYFQIYLAYASLHRTDSVFRKNTPKRKQYDAKLIVNMRNAVKLLKIVVLQKLEMHEKVYEVWNKEQSPSLTLTKNNEIIFYKINEFDRQSVEMIRPWAET